MNPIEALRNYAARTIGVQKLEYNFQVYFVFGDVAWPKTTLAGFPILGNTDESYTLEELLFCHDSRGMNYDDYVTKAELEGVRPVHKMERYYVRKVLNGRYLEKTCRCPLARPTLASWVFPRLQKPQPKRARVEEKRPILAKRSKQAIVAGRDLMDLKTRIIFMQNLWQSRSFCNDRNQVQQKYLGEYSRYSQERFPVTLGVDFDTEMTFRQK